MKPQKIDLNNQSKLCCSENIGSSTWTSIGGWSYKLESSGVNRPKTKTNLLSGNGEVCAPMPGQILKILVANKQTVKTGDSLFVVEAMKMEHTLKAPCSGVITDLNFKAGDTVSGNDIILKINKASSKDD